jgi:eukaryotic-like serine/threonine-protein kinase
LYAFGPFRVDTVRGILLRDSEPVPLTGKCFDVLLALIAHYPDTVSKDLLMKSAWPNTFVEESNLTQHISMLRKALGESPQDRLYIVTVPGEGYRFVTGVLEIQPATDGAPTDVDTNPTDGLDKTVQHEISLSGGRLFAAVAQIKWIAVGSLIVLLATVAVLWMRQIRASRSLKERDSVVIADFDNSTGESVFDGTVKEGLAVELGQSPFLDLVSSDRVRATLRLMGHSPDEPVKSPLAREICERLGAKALISGSVARLGKSYVIDVEAEACADAAVLAREQVEAKSPEEVLPLLGTIGSKLRRKLGESMSSIQQFDAPLEQATTPSLEALKSYTLGIQARTRGSEKASVPLFEHAIDVDPNFAMAYAQLSAVYSNLGESDKGADYMKTAFDLRDNLSERESLYLSARYYSNVAGELDKATETYDLWSKLYPRDWRPFNGLATRYQVVGKYEEAKVAAEHALSLQPNHYSPYANLAVTQLSLNHLDEAEKVCLRAGKAGHDSIYTHRVLFDIAFLRHDETAMQRQVNWAKGKDSENEMLTTRALSFAAVGKMQAARQLFAQSQSASLSSGLNDNAAYSMAREALIEADFGDLDRAKKQAIAALSLGRGIDADETAAEALALSGEDQKARDVVEDLKLRFPHHGPLNLASLPSTLAAVEMQHEHPTKAIQILVPAAPFDLSEFANLSPVYIRGQAYLGARSGAEAAAEFQKIIDHVGVDVTSPRHTLAYLGLARASSLNNDQAKSRAAYQQFFALWSNADSDNPVLRAARQEYGNLK